MSDRIEIHTEPDERGRVQYTKFWRAERPAYCGNCGTSPDAEGNPRCSCYGPHEAAQVFFGVPLRKRRR